MMTHVREIHHYFVGAAVYKMLGNKFKTPFFDLSGINFMFQ